VEVGDRQADARFLLETTGWRDHEDGRGLHRVLGGEDQFAMVIATFVRAIFEAIDTVVPFEDVLCVWYCHKILHRSGSGELLVLFL